MVLLMGEIYEIICVLVLEYLVLVDDCCFGCVYLCGVLVLVFDFVCFFGLECCFCGIGELFGQGEDLCWVFVLCQGDFYLGLLVDEVDSIVVFLEV